MLSGKELKIKRVTLGIPAKEIAKALDVSKPFVTYMEKEVKKIPTDKYEKWTLYLQIKEKEVVQ